MKSEFSRLFTAVDISTPLKTEIQRLYTSLKTIPAQWIPPENLHITLKFLGKTSFHQENTLSEKLSQIPFQSFSVSISSGNFFSDSKGQPTVFYLSVHSPELVELSSLIEKIALSLGFPPETRKFTPHLTLARIKKPLTPPQIKEFLIHTEKIRSLFQVHSFCLYNSLLTSKGSLYEKKKEFLCL